MMRGQEDYKTNKEGFSESALLEKLVRTFEMMDVDKDLLQDFRHYVDQENYHQAWFVLKEHNTWAESGQEIKLVRPQLHGYDEDNVFSRLVQEAYVTARLFNADDRLLNSILSGDWEQTGSFEGER